MEIEALKYLSDKDENSFMQCSLKIESSSDIKGLENDKIPHAYVVKASCLEMFHNYLDIIDDRGSKDERESLYRKMERAHKTSIIDGKNYRSPSQFSRSIYMCLKKAVKNNKYHLFIIGAPDTIFAELFKKAAGCSRAKHGSADGFKFPDSIMRLMENHSVPDELTEAYLGKSKEAEFVRRLILLAAKKDTPVLIVGATGTGKEVVARAIHDYSEHKPSPGTEPESMPNGEFVAVNCGAITSTLFESELFGHVKGAFTGALKDKTGYWKKADGGTLFLDEIGDLPLDMQVKILRALQEKKIRPVGFEKEIPVDARIIAATNRDIFSMVQSGTFREDLYYRLRDFFIPTPSLKDHPDDIPLMAEFFWKNIPGDNKAPLSLEILAGFQEYRWPGNARELKAVLNQLNTLFPAKTNLTVDYLFAVFDLEGQSSGHKSEPRKKSGQEQPCSKFECRRHLRRVEDTIRAAEIATLPLANHHGKNDKVVSKVAESLAYRLDELDMLCRYPLRFNDETTFVRVNALKSKLFYLHTLLASGEVEKALSNWGNSVQEEFAVTLSEVRGEIEAIRAGKRL